MLLTQSKLYIFPRVITMHNFMTIYSVVLLTSPSHQNFACSPCCYNWLQENIKYVAEVAFSVLWYVPTTILQKQ